LNIRADLDEDSKKEVELEVNSTNNKEEKGGNNMETLKSEVTKCLTPDDYYDTSRIAEMLDISFDRASVLITEYKKEYPDRVESIDSALKPKGVVKEDYLEDFSEYIGKEIKQDLPSAERERGDNGYDLNDIAEIFGISSSYACNLISKFRKDYSEKTGVAYASFSKKNSINKKHLFHFLRKIPESYLDTVNIGREYNMEIFKEIIAKFEDIEEKNEKLNKKLKRVNNKNEKMIDQLLEEINLLKENQQELISENNSEGFISRVFPFIKRRG